MGVCCVPRNFLLQVLHESSALIAGGGLACVGFTHPLVTMTRNIVVEGITQGAWNQEAEIE